LKEDWGFNRDNLQT